MITLVEIKKAPWEQKVILAANQCLESQYQRDHLACTALQISRNYRLLSEQEDKEIKKSFWLELAELWKYCYQQTVLSVGQKQPNV